MLKSFLTYLEKFVDKKFINFFQFYKVAKLCWAVSKFGQPGHLDKCPCPCPGCPGPGVHLLSRLESQCNSCLLHAEAYFLCSFLLLASCSSFDLFDHTPFSLFDLRPLTCQLWAPIQALRRGPKILAPSRRITLQGSIRKVDG